VVVTAQPAPPPLPDELMVLLRRMRLPYLRGAAPEVLATARSQRWDPAKTLRVLLTEEIRGRDEATRRQHRRAAGLPAGKTFASWRQADSSIPAPTQQALATLEWIGRAENLAVTGPDREDPPGRGARARRDRHRPPGRLVHPRIVDRRGRARRRGRFRRPHHHQDHPRGSARRG